MILWSSVMPRWRDPGSPPPLGVAEWVDQALCASEPGDWFPDLSRPVDLTSEREVCGRCPVRQACLAYALDAGEPYGIWGGLTTNERLTLIEHLTALAAAAAADPGPSRA